MKRALLLGWGMMLWCGTAYAQLPGIDINLGPRIGVFTPLGALAENALGQETKISSGLGIGGSIEIDIPLSPVNVRANIDVALNRSLEQEGQELPNSDVDILALTGDLVLRPLPRIIVVQPYLLAGAGVKKYSFEGAAEDTNDFTGHVGIGVDLRVGPLFLVGEISDYISSFESAFGSKIQNDLFAQVGLRIGLL